jgi:hypothetical protein
MPEPYGRKMPLSLPRRLICDLMHFAQQVPSVPVQRRMNVAPLIGARQAATPRPSWCAVFTKAFATIAGRQPQFRRAYLPYPRPHLYEHPNNIASIAISRRYQDEDAVFFAHMRSPEKQGLGQIDSFLQYCKDEPVESIALFRWALRVCHWPLPVRRALWWFGLKTSGYRRAHRIGTFGVSVYSGLGAGSLHPLSPLTTTLNYGVIEANGDVDVRLIYDHRVLDGGTVARALGDMEEVLHHEILAELEGMQVKARPTVLVNETQAQANGNGHHTNGCGAVEASTVTERS